MKPCTLLIIEPHPEVRHALAARLEDSLDINVVGETGDVDEAVYLANLLQPEFILLEPKRLDSTRLVRQLSEVAPSARIIVYTSYFDLFEQDALGSSVSVYLLKSLNLDELRPWLRNDEMPTAPG